MTDFGDGWSRLVVLLTPNFQGSVWYEKDIAGSRLVIHGQSDGEVSYRLTAPRFDWQKWGNLADYQSIEGLLVPS